MKLTEKTFVFVVFFIWLFFPLLSRAFSDGSLVSDKGTLYFIENGLKRPFASQGIFKALGFKSANIKPADTSQVALGPRIATSKIRHPRGANVSYKGTVYFMGKDVRYPYPSADIFYSWNSDFSAVVPANFWDLKVPVASPVELNSQSSYSFTPPANNGQNSNNNPATTTGSVLQSNFLKNDPTAQAIASGQTKNYDISQFQFDYNNGTDTHSFAFRFLSALRMTGNIFGYNRDANLAQTALNRFQKIYGLPVSAFVDAAVLKKVDDMLVLAESRDAAAAPTFPLYSHFLEAPVNEPTKDHSAALFAMTFKELPTNLVAWNEQNFKSYLSSQLKGTSKDIGTDNYQICDEKMYSEYGDECTLVKDGKTLPLWGDDFEIANTMIHEYAHYLDRNLYPQVSGISQGAIDTTGFYAITYNLSDMKTNSSGWKFYTLSRPDNAKNEFVGSYAFGWTLSDGSPYWTPYEDFAESFALYVDGAKTFRELAAANPVLKQKYDWLKQNVFNGQEYQSGVTNAVAALANLPTAAANKALPTGANTGAFNIRDFIEASPDFVWNYKFLSGSQAN